MIPMEKSAKALVLAAGSLGDCLLTLSALQTLQKRFRVTVAGTSPYLELGPSLLGLDEVIPLDPLLQNLYAPKTESSFGPDFWNGFTDVFLFLKEVDDKTWNTLSSLFGGKVHGLSQTFESFLKESKWAGDFWLRLALPSGQEPEEAARHPRLMIPDTLRREGKSLCDSLKTTRPFIIHPGSGSPSKNAPLSFFKKAAEKITAETTDPVLILWGEAEQSWISEIQATFQGMPRVSLLPQPLALPQVAALFTQSCGYLGNDSGVTHLASACGVKTFAVFTVTNHHVWGPQEAFILESLKTIYS
jgi:ADP-heptose:LPS heptosyltransferase